MTKEDLLGMYRTSHNNCKLVYAAMLLFLYEDIPPFYTKLSAAIKVPNPYDQKEIIALLHDRPILKLALGQLYDTVYRAAIKELFEITKSYCKDTNQGQVFSAQPWYQFWRILRNCFSHDFTFHFRDYDRKQLPVTWSGVTLDVSLEGQFITHGAFSRENILELLDEVRDFIEKDLA